MTGWLPWSQANGWPWSAICLFPRGTLQSLVASLFSSFSPVALGHWSVCRFRISLSTLWLSLCLGKFLRLPWVLRRQAWIPGSPLPHAARLRWRLKAGLSCGGLCGLGVSGPLFSGGAGRPFVWSLERLDRVSLQSLALFLTCVCI